MTKRVLDVLDVQDENGAMTPASRHSFSSSQARKEFGSVLDLAEHGGLVIVNRGRTRSAVVSADRLREHLAATTPARARISVDHGVYVVFLEGRPFASEGSTGARG